MDIPGTFRDLKELVGSIFDHQFSDLEISWASGSIETTDPFDRVKLRFPKIILREGPADMDYWEIDITRALVIYLIEDKINNDWSCWQFSTLVALLIMPSTIITDSKKTQYRKKWLDLESLQGSHRRYNYLRWYNLLSAYSRVAVIDLLLQFIATLPQEGRLETQFNTYLHEYIASYYEIDDIEVLLTALEEQTIEVKELDAVLPQYSKEKLYRILSRLSFHLDEYYLPNIPAYGLTGIILFFDNDDGIEKLQTSPFYQNTEHFKENNQALMKYLIPTNKVDDLIQISKIRQKNYPRIYLRVPASRILAVTPGMFDTDDKVWRSVKDTYSRSVKIQLEEDTQQKPITVRELQVLQRILRSRTEDHLKLSIDHSQSKTKRIVRSIRRKELFIKKVLWRSPSDLSILTLILPHEEIADIGNTGPIDNAHELIKGVSLNNDYQGWDYLVDKSWPWFFHEDIIEIGKNLKPMRLVRIGATSDDLLELVSKYQKQLIGIHSNNPGSMLNIPIDQFHDGVWSFDIETFSEKLR